MEDNIGASVSRLDPEAVHWEAVHQSVHVLTYVQLICLPLVLTVILVLSL